MYVILRGQVTLVKVDYELGIEMPISTLKVGESFGDLSIQGSLINPFELVTKNTIYARCDSS